MNDERVSLGDAVELLAESESGPAGAKLLADLMEHSATHDRALLSSLLEAEKEAAARWRERALYAEHQLQVVERRMRDLVHAPYGTLPGEDDLA